ncbi:MAG: cation-transporting P-type ATPase [Calditrichia bacterium]
MSESKQKNIIREPWNRSVDDLLQELFTDREDGLSSAEVKKRQKKYGKNLLRETRRKSAWQIWLNQFESLIMLLLAVAAVVSFIFGEWMQGVAVIAVIFITVIIGFSTEIRAVRSMEALRELSRVSANVRRDGRVKQVLAEALVPGDIVVLDGGDIVTADLRLIEANKLQADEAALTGESLPVSKNIERAEEEAPLAERKNMLFKGTAVTRGSGAGVVVATGMNTELGKISALVEEAEEEMTPLEQRLDQLGRRLVWVTLGIAAVVAALGIFRGKAALLMIETAIALAVAAIPEGLPIVATIALARGMMRMAKRNVLINRLSSVEILGATSVIFTDKTGTLTENRMAVARLVTDPGEFNFNGSSNKTEEGNSVDLGNIGEGEKQTIHIALKVGVLCNNASLTDDEQGGVGDPLEIALLDAGRKLGLERDELLDEMPEAREEAFDPETKMMATFNQQNDDFLVAVKGAPEAVLKSCNTVFTADAEKNVGKAERRKWLDLNDRLAKEGLRILALAQKTEKSAGANPYEKLTLLGLVGLLDPPRDEVRDAIQLCRRAGIRIIMVTGDQTLTARNIAFRVGLMEKPEAEALEGKTLDDYENLSDEDKNRFLEAGVFSRVSPTQKLELITLHQENGAVVAMTGDGVNDALALKKADIGIAMGKRGTQVAREAADMILKDDAFSTIVTAVRYGRAIFTNIRKFVIFLLSGNVGEVLAVATASVIDLPLPVLPLQILFINLVLDVFPALALGIGEGDPGIMSNPPRDPEEPVLTGKHWLLLAGYGYVISLSILGALAIALFPLEMAPEKAITLSFLTLAFARLWHVFNMRDSDDPVFLNEITKNPYVWGAIALCRLLLLAAVYIPGLAEGLSVVRPGAAGWAVIIGMSLAPLIIIQVAKIAEDYLLETE